MEAGHLTQNRERPLIAVIGTGAIGGVVAASLALKAAESHARIIACTRQTLNGLRLDVAGGEQRTATIESWTSPLQAERADWVILATKAHQIPEIAPWLTRLCDSTTRVAVLQNGIHHAERLQDWLAPQQVLPVIVYFNGERLERAHVRLTQVGECDLLVPDTALGEQFMALLAGTPVRVHSSADQHTLAWRKLLLNAIANPITALTQRRLEVFEEPEIQALAHGILDEAIAVARADGAAIALAEKHAIIEKVLSYPPTAGTSMYFDRLAGAALEADAITGAIVTTARRMNIPCPVNATLLSLLKAVGQRQPAAATAVPSA